ncbi:MAG: hypothetical protein GHCLOJNM_01692 [bacterium]|nr:hypothetical protein [bacterium]
MTRVGSYNAGFEGPTSSLFVYGESPVTSAKLNRWNGNIEAGFRLLHRLVRILAGGDSAPYLVGNEGTDPLKVSAQATPSLTVKVASGIALGPTYAMGLSSDETVPAAGAFVAPSGNPRIDSIGIRETGEWVIAAGTESATPSAPLLDPDVVRLADVYLRVGATSIKNSDDGVNGYLIDRRPRRLSALAHRHVAPASPPETPNGSATNFSTSERFVAGTLRVYVNGLAQLPSTHYTEDSDREGYTFLTAPPSGFVIHHEYQPG